MAKPLLLIAGREFRTYVATLSFWLALAVAPLLTVAALFLSGGASQPVPVFIAGSEMPLVQSARAALEEAGSLEGRQFVFQRGGAELAVNRPVAQNVELTYSNGFPLSPEARAIVALTIERDLARATSTARLTAVREKVTKGGVVDAVRLSRLVAMAMLWLTLTGSLGMLLQAVVRERANRALESLLAAAQGWEIVTGKILGVGAVSLLILGAWLGSASLFSFFLSSQNGLVPAVLASLVQPLELLRDALIYVCTFAFYGAITVALGALARDSASAQNAVRPMFVLLLAAFFIALTVPARSEAFSWLSYLPPFTPFLLLVNSPKAVAPEIQLMLLAMLAAAGMATVLLATKLLSVSPGTYQIFTRNSGRSQPLV